MGKRGRLRGLCVRVRRHHRFQVLRGQFDEHAPHLRDGRRQLQQLAPRRHAIQSDREVIPAPRRVHLSRDIAPQQGLDEEEQVLIRAVVSRPRNPLAIQALESSEQRVLLLLRQNALPRQHPRMREMDLDQ